MLTEGPSEVLVADEPIAFRVRLQYALKQGLLTIVFAVRLLIELVRGLTLASGTSARLLLLCLQLRIYIVVVA